MRVETGSTSLPDCRSWEQVTPVEKNGALIGGLFAEESDWPPQLDKDGQDIISPNIQCFANPESCTGIRRRAGDPYEFARTSNGWVTHTLAPPSSQLEVSTVWAVDAETHSTLYSAADPSVPNPTEALDDFYVRHGEGALTKIGPVSEIPEVKKIEKNFAATSDFSRIVFSGLRFWSLDGSLEENNSLYEYAGAGHSQPISVGVSGGQGSTSLISSCGTELGGGNFSQSGENYGAISESGRTVYFTTQCGISAGYELYARVDGESSDAHTVAISAPIPSTSALSSCKTVECETAPRQDAIFAGASTDGSRVFFTSTGQLTDDASQGTGQAGTECGAAPGNGCNLYESICAEPCGGQGEAPAAKERELIDLSAGAKEAGGPRVQGVVAISPDGSHVYYVAHGVLTEQENQNHEKAANGANNLYAYANGQPLKFIASLPAADRKTFSHSQNAQEWSNGAELANVTPDGRFLVFLSHGALTRDDTDTKLTAPAQVYRYDSDTGLLVRISIGENGYNDNGNAAAAAADAGIRPARTGWNLGIGPGRANPTMSEDASYVFFESPVALTPGALNEVEIGNKALAENVYEYHEGTVSLISDGKDTTPKSGTPGIFSSVELLGTDESGRNVFFTTNDQLVPQDTDTQRDYYDAHICTPEEPCPTQPPPPPAACEGEACQGSPSAPPSLSVPGSLVFTGEGNLAPPPPAVVKPKPKAKVTKCKKGLMRKHNKCVRASKVKDKGRKKGRK